MSRSGWRRMRLRRADGRVYLDRWGFSADRIGRIYLHRMEAADPGFDLHDHPWAFGSLILWGGYIEEVAPTRRAPYFAQVAEKTGGRRGHLRGWSPGSWHTIRLDECHRITDLTRKTCWTLVIGGPRRRKWGFYLPSGWVDDRTYDETVRAERRDMWNEDPAQNKGWAPA